MEEFKTEIKESHGVPKTQVKMPDRNFRYLFYRLMANLEKRLTTDNANNRDKCQFQFVLYDFVTAVWLYPLLFRLLAVFLPFVIAGEKHSRKGI